MTVDIDDDPNSSEGARTDRGVGANSSAFDLVRNSLSLKITIAGALVVLVAFVMNTGVWPAILAIWGGALVLIGTASFLLVQFSQRGTRG